jgi:hypothetical protein
MADTCLASCMLASRFLAMDVYSVIDSVTSGTWLLSRCLVMFVCFTVLKDLERDGYNFFQSSILGFPAWNGWLVEHEKVCIIVLIYHRHELLYLMKMLSYDLGSQDGIRTQSYKDTSLDCSFNTIFNFFLFVRWNFGYCGHYWPILPAPDDRWWWL